MQTQNQQVYQRQKEMIEVFKTDVNNKDQADRLLAQIHKTFRDYKANFDLEDCDKILRVKCTTGSIQSFHIISFLKRLGCNAEVLPDDDQPFDGLSVISHIELSDASG